jgi:hypothetical protein
MTEQKMDQPVVIGTWAEYGETMLMFVVVAFAALGVYVWKDPDAWATFVLALAWTSTLPWPWIVLAFYVWLVLRAIANWTQLTRIADQGHDAVQRERAAVGRD